MSDATKTTIPRSVLISVRAVLQTCRNDTETDLAKPERARVIDRRIAEITAALDGGIAS